MGILSYKDVDKCIVSTIDKLGNEIIIAAPLGLGKPVQVLNSFYKYAKQNPEIKLTILTALSLIRPKVNNDLANRLAAPVLDRLYAGYIDLDYEVDRRAEKLPDNVKVIEFYLTPGEYIHNDTAQQDYVCSNYTHVVRDIMHYKVNVITQLISERNEETGKYSLSCNADLTLDLIAAANDADDIEQKPLLLGEVNKKLPYMSGSGVEVAEEEFHAIVDNENYANLFQIPRPAVSEQDFMIGLYVSSLIKDNGCLQIGIGSLSEAVVANLINRHKHNPKYLKLLKSIKLKEKFGAVANDVGETAQFNSGLFASTEMLVDGFIDLYDNDILSKRVYDDPVLQRLLNDGQISEEVTPNTLEQLLAHNRISMNLTESDFKFLQFYGVMKSATDLKYNDGYLYHSDTTKIPADLNNIQAKEFIYTKCLGHHLKNGRVAHAGFFVGSNKLYQYLSTLSDEKKQNFDMRSIKKINQLYNTEKIDTLQRLNARFFNATMKVTLLGAVASDTIENAQVISGVGGQYNFVAMAHELKGARSIIGCKSTYNKNRKLFSNIVWKYGVTTIPRHLRDIVVTEYGIADCRSKTDSEVIKALLNITDSRFQNELLAKAKKYGKLPASYQIPKLYTNNYPEAIRDQLKSNQGNSLYSEYPFGTELTGEEIKIKAALTYLKNQPKWKILLLMAKGLLITPNRFRHILSRMQLEKPGSIKEHSYRALLLSACSASIKSDI